MLFGELKNGEFFYNQGRYYIKSTEALKGECNALCVKSKYKHIAPGDSAIYFANEKVRRCSLKDVVEGNNGGVKFKDLEVGTKFTHRNLGDCIKIETTYEVYHGEHIKVNTLRLWDYKIYAVKDDELVYIDE